MNNIVPFNKTNTIPAEMMAAFSMFEDINKDVVRAPSFPSMSIKGKVFTQSKDGIKRIIMKPGADGEEEVAQAIGVVVLRANMNAKTYYAKKFVEGASDNQLPDCYSFDGEVPSPHSKAKQCDKCAICPHNQWGSRVSDGDQEESKGKACADNARLAIATPDKLTEPMLLRVPPASLKPLREAVKELGARKVPYNVVVTRVGFDPQAASPKLTFRPAGYLPTSVYPTLKEMYENEVVRSIVGVDDAGADTVAPGAPADETDSPVEQAQQVVAKAKAQAKAEPKAEAKPKAEPKPLPKSVDSVIDAALDDEPAPAPAPAPAPVKAKVEPKPEPKAEPAKGSAAANLLGDLDTLLGGFDD